MQVQQHISTSEKMEASEGCRAPTTELEVTWPTVEKKAAPGVQRSSLTGQSPCSTDTSPSNVPTTTTREANRSSIKADADTTFSATPHHNLLSESVLPLPKSPLRCSSIEKCTERMQFLTPPNSFLVSTHGVTDDFQTKRTRPFQLISSSGSEEPSAPSKSSFLKQEGNDRPLTPPRGRQRSLLQPLASIQNPDEAPLVLEQNRIALVAELVRRKNCLQRQLMQIQMELSSKNIFSLVRASNASEIQYLLENGLCNVNKRDYNGCTPLHVAALEGNQIIVRILISFGADVLSIDNTGRTPLDWAAANRHGSVCRLLLGATQCLKHVQEQQQRQVQVEENITSREKVILPEDSSIHSNTSTLTPSITACRASPRQHSRFSLLLSPPSADAEMISEQQNEKFSNSLLNSQYVCDTLPPDIVPLLQAQCASTVSPASSIPSRFEDVLQDVYEGGGECRISAFSNYTTVSDTVSLVVCMVGLPGRGKSFIGRRIARYLNWKGVPCRVFNAGCYRRKFLGVEGTAESEFFDPNNTTGKDLREKMANLACYDLVEFIQEHRFAVGVFDATNTTRERRRHLVEFFSHARRQRNVDCRVIFIESICTDDTIITENILRSKCGNDDFKNVTDTSEAVASFRSRIAEYEKVYEPLDQSENLSFIRIINVKRHVVLHNIPCGLGSLIAFFLQNLHPVAYPIYIALPGETEGDRSHVYGGDERLTPLGEKYALSLKRFIMERYVPHTVVLHGTNRSVISTLQPLAKALGGGENSGEDGEKEDNGSNIFGSCNVSMKKEMLCPLPGLDSINYGRFSGKTALWVRTKFARLSRLLYTALPVGSVESPSEAGDPFVSVRERPDEKGKQQQIEGICPPSTQHFDQSVDAIRRFHHVPNGTDPRMSYCVQFPNGESCRQVNVRLEPALMAVMRVQGPVFVIASSVPAQGVLAFLTDVLPEMSPTLRLPQHAVVEIGVKGDITVHQCMES